MIGGSRRLLGVGNNELIYQSTIGNGACALVPLGLGSQNVARHDGAGLRVAQVVLRALHVILPSRGGSLLSSQWGRAIDLAQMTKVPSLV